jgi:hypothetical protein
MKRARCPEEALVDARDTQFEAQLGKALSELGRAERTSEPAPDWAAFAARLERPGLLDRAPLGLAAAVRGAGAFLQPAAAGAVAATLAGLALGTWLALSFSRGPATGADSQAYEDSSLFDDEASVLAASYFTLAGDGATEDSPADAGGADSGGAVR